MPFHPVLLLQKRFSAFSDKDIKLAETHAVPNPTKGEHSSAQTVTGISVSHSLLGC
jgi:hypothetical protein